MILEFYKDINATKKEDVFEFIGNNKSNEKISKDEIMKALFKRESEISTGLINNIGLPHAQIPGIDEAHITIIRLNNDVEDWDSLDGMKINFIINFLVPENSDDLHIKILSTFSKKLIKEEFQNQLKEVEDLNELEKLLSFVEEIKK